MNTVASLGGRKHESAGVSEDDSGSECINEIEDACTVVSVSFYTFCSS